MKLALIILGILFLLLFLLLVTRVRVSAEYDATGLTARLRAGPLSIRLYPAKPKRVKKPRRAKKPRREKKPKRGKAAEPEEKKGGALSDFQALLPTLGRTLGRVRDKLRIDRLFLDLTWGGSDPAQTAIGYGYANAAIGMLWPFFEGFRIRKHRIRTAVNFDLASPTVYVHAAVSMTVWQGLTLAVPLLVQVIKSRRKRQTSNKEAATS